MTRKCIVLLLSFAGTALCALPTTAMLIRTIDGSSNNAGHADWGAAGAPLLRLSANAYADGAGVPRGGYDSTLPGPRALSNALSAQTMPRQNARRASDWLWQWGQFLDHDLDLVETAHGSDAFDIPVPSGDPAFDPLHDGNIVIPLQRSMFADGAGVREQINALTSFIDASSVYGSDPLRAASLRDDAGRLRMSAAMNGEMLMGYNVFGLPNGTSGAPGVNAGDFFLAGDVRANEQIGLTAAHTVFAREHNRLVDALLARLRDGDAALLAERDRTLAASGNGVHTEADFVYEAARKVVGAQIQKITYAEFLPLLLGVDLTAAYSTYDAAINPGVSNEFAAAAFRMGHTMLSPRLLRVDPHAAHSILEEVPLRAAFFNPAAVFENGVDSLLLGLARQRAQTIDTLIIDDVRNFLFGPPGAGGLDLPALNIQRGRDHGVDGLNGVRAALGLAPYTDFSTMTGGNDTLAATFAGIYADINDVDLWIGGLAEAASGASMLGETFSAILNDQFMRSMRGDRFFYLYERDVIDLLDPGFANHSTLAGIIKRNSSITRMHAHAFVVVPEPSSLALGILALAALVSQRRAPGRGRGAPVRSLRRRG